MTVTSVLGNQRGNPRNQHRNPEISGKSGNQTGNREITGNHWKSEISYAETARVGPGPVDVNFHRMLLILLLIVKLLFTQLIAAMQRPCIGGEICLRYHQENLANHS